jgi:hypothetical protein
MICACIETSNAEQARHNRELRFPGKCGAKADTLAPSAVQSSCGYAFSIGPPADLTITSRFIEHIRLDIATQESVPYGIADHMRGPATKRVLEDNLHIPTQMVHFPLAGIRYVFALEKPVRPCIKKV